MTELHVLYRYFDEDDTLLYVGITNSPLARMSKHLRDKAWFRKAIRTTYQHFPNRAELEAAEVKAIREERPKYNIAHSVGPVPQQIGVKRRVSYSSSSDANRFRAPDAIASEEPLSEECAELLLEMERQKKVWIRDRHCPTCRRRCLYREYDGLISCSDCLNMFTPDGIPSDLDLLKRHMETKESEK